MKKPLLLFVILLIFSFLRSSNAGEVLRAGAGLDGVQRAEITGGSYFFKPDRVIVRVNTPVELTLKKEPGLTPHNFVLKAPEADIDISVSLSEEPKKVAFTPTKAGEYPFYCDKRLLFFKSHRAKGMEGTLVVEGE